MGNTFSRSWALGKESYAILKGNPQLALFPIISGVASVLVMIAFAIPIFLTNPSQRTDTSNPLYYGLLFAFYVVSYFVVIFFNSGLVCCAHDSLQGKPTSFSAGLANATKHLPAILGWALIAATVGMLLRIIQERVGIVGRIIVGIFGFAWTLLTYFVVPVMVVDNKGPVTALKESASMLRKTWGEQLIANVSVTLAVGVFMLFGFIPIGVGIFFGVNNLIIPMISAFALAILYWLALAVVASALSGIFNTALYIYASTGQIPSGFSENSIRMAFAARQNRGVFGIGGNR